MSKFITWQLRYLVPTWKKKEAFNPTLTLWKAIAILLIVLEATQRPRRLHLSTLLVKTTGFWWCFLKPEISHPTEDLRSSPSACWASWSGPPSLPVPQTQKISAFSCHRSSRFTIPTSIRTDGSGLSFSFFPPLRPSIYPSFPLSLPPPATPARLLSFFESERWSPP